MYRLLLTAGLAKADSDSAQDTAYNAVSTLAAIGTGILTRKVLTSLWTRRTGEEPPANPADSSVAWREALTWAAATGAGVGVGRVVGRRLAAGAWAKASAKRQEHRAG